MKKITRDEYMKDSSNLFEAYYSQFVTRSTLDFVRKNIGLKKLKSSKCKHFNDIIKLSNNGQSGWVWDYSPFNLSLAVELGEVGERCSGSMSTHTCIGKAAARMVLNQIEA